MKNGKVGIVRAATRTWQSQAPRTWQTIVDYGYIVLPMIIVMYEVVLKTVCAYLDWRQVIALAANGIYGMS